MYNGSVRKAKTEIPVKTPPSLLPSIPGLVSERGSGLVGDAGGNIINEKGNGILSDNGAGLLSDAGGNIKPPGSN